ncbi:MAG: SdpI family protein [Oscillospiraceae bacterium]|nr:SdpI family protein [Oscillospiraceae bacterium]
MKFISKKLYIFPALALLISLCAYPLLPEQIPVHFDFSGTPDNYSGKWFVLVIPAIMAALLLLAEFLPKWDPKSDNYSKFPKAYQLIHILTQILLLVTHIATIAYPLLQENGFGFSLSSNINIGHIVSPAVGIMLMVIGNYMPKFKQSFFCGIKTPWALADEEIWYKTHRLVGTLWVIGGFLFVLVPFMNETLGTVILFADLFILVLVPYAYSYWIYREKFK